MRAKRGIGSQRFSKMCLLRMRYTYYLLSAPIFTSAVVPRIAPQSRLQRLLALGLRPILIDRIWSRADRGVHLAFSCMLIGQDIDCIYKYRFSRQDMHGSRVLMSSVGPAYSVELYWQHDTLLRAYRQNSDMTNVGGGGLPRYIGTPLL